MPPSPSDSDDLSVAMASGEESVGSRLGVATSRSNGSVVSMVVGSSASRSNGSVVSMVVCSSESIVTDVAVSGSRASDMDLASDSDSDVGETASGGLPRPGQVLEVVSRGRASGGFPPMCRRPADLKLNLEHKWRFRMASFGIVCVAGFAR